MLFPLPYSFCKTHLVLAQGTCKASKDDQEIELFYCNQSSFAALAEVKRQYQVKHMALLSQEALMARVGEAYTNHDAQAADVVNAYEGDVDLTRLMEDLPPVQDLLEAEDSAPIVRMLNALLMQAVRDGASDMHIEPFERSCVVRFRIDGTLRDVVSPNKALHAALISRLKIMAELDIAEKRLPQDGRLTLKLGGRSVDVRVSTLPCSHGERAVLRILDKSSVKLELTHIGMPDNIRDQFSELVRQPHGIVLVTGPTGSGKTTTLYAALGLLDSTSTNILTVEDPVEFDLAGVGQTQINPRIGLTFARALRSILRQDPNVIMIGEIRDAETAQIAVQASLTGHLVLATLHTNNAPAAVTRLLDMGIEPFLLASTLQGVLAQRLMRLLCPVCKTQSTSAEANVTAEGCAACGYSGYRGRTGIFELMLMSDALRQTTHEQQAEEKIRQIALTQGMVRLRDDGLRLVNQGLSSWQELIRVTRD